MQPYQSEYILNLKAIIALTERKMASGYSYEEYHTLLLDEREQIKKKVKHNIDLLRENLFPLFDNLDQRSRRICQSPFRWKK